MVANYKFKITTCIKNDITQRIHVAEQAALPKRVVTRPSSYSECHPDIKTYSKAYGSMILIIWEVKPLLLLFSNGGFNHWVVWSTWSANPSPVNE